MCPKVCRSLQLLQQSPASSFSLLGAVPAHTLQWALFRVAGNGAAVGSAFTQTFILPWEQGDFWGLGVSLLPSGWRQEHSSRCAEKAAVTSSFPCFQKS